MIVGGVPRHPFEVELPWGRRVSMDSLYMDFTYGDVLEGDPSYTPPARWYEHAVSRALHVFYLQGRAERGRGVWVVEPELRESPPYPAKPHVPYVEVMAFCSSWFKAKGTALAIVWFQDSFDEPLFERFRAAVLATPWEEVAIEWLD